MQVAPVRLRAPLYIVITDLVGEKDTVEILRTLRRAVEDPAHPQHKDLCSALGDENHRLMENAVICLE